MDVDLDAYNEAPGAPRRAPRPSRGPRLWRCEPMSLVQLFIQYDAARDTVDELGNLGIVQFKDLNANVSAFARVFVADVKRAEEMERRLRYLKQVRGPPRDEKGCVRHSPTRAATGHARH